MAARSHRPHHHPNRRRPEEIQRIDNLRRRSPNTNLGCFGSNSGREGIHDSSPAFTGSCANGVRGRKLPHPKYIPKPHEQMTRPGQREQIDVKFVPAACLVGDAVGQKFYQFTSTPSSTSVPVFAIPRLLRNTAPFLPASSFTMLLRSSLMPLRISKPIPVQFTNRRNASKAGRPARLEKTLSGLCIRRKHIRSLYAPPQRQSGAQSPQRQRRILRLSQVLFFRCLCRSACPQTALLQQLPPAPPQPTLP